MRAPGIETLLADMRDTMRAQNGAGLAAPQIGVGLRVVIFGVERNPRYPDVEPVPYTELINPVVTDLSSEMEEGWEGCLSVPGLRGVVPRATRSWHSHRNTADGSASTSTPRNHSTVGPVNTPSHG